MKTVRAPSLVALLIVGTHAVTAVGEALPEFRLWTNPKAKPVLPHTNRVVEHPCGEVAEVRINRLPAYSRHAYLQPERVFEIGPTKRIIRTWVMPVDAYVLGVDGDKLYFGLYKDTFAVTLDRKVERAGEVPAFTRPQETQCKTPTEIAPSDYSACLTYQDLRTQSPRTLVYELVCT